MVLHEDLVLKALDEALSLGASYAEVRYQRDEVSEVALRNGNVIGFGKDVSEGMGIRVIVDGALGFASTNMLTIDEVRSTVERAVSRAKALAKLMREPISFSEERVGRASYNVIPKKDLSELSIEDRVTLGIEIHKSIINTVREVKVAVTAFFIRDHIQEKFIVNSDGAYIKSYIPRLSIMLNFVLAHPQKGTLQRYLSYGASGGSELIKEWKPEEEIVDEVKNLERVLVKGKEPPNDEIDVVVGPEVVGLIVHESAGHPMEADRILGREAAQAGESFVKPEMIGKYRIGTELVTIVEDPTIPGSYGYYLYDDEGVPARPRYLYYKGIINEPLHNRHTGKIFGVGSNGAARAMNYKSEPIIRMSNTYFKPGNMEFDELIEDIKLGVYIKSFMEWNIDDIRWNQRYVGLEAYIIRDGEVKEDEPVRNPVLEITTQGFYSRVTGVDKNLRFYPATCGKGEPAQGVPVWIGGPNVRVSRIRLGVRV